ncbi:MAG: PAC2 family protein [Candidatus Aenigmarchaeota archaeon]|nr:PAC2 family protein [Candidatus Aenigmarchaeota archaeon]
METGIRILNKVKAKNPVLVVGMPGIGNVGRVAAGYMVSELKMKKFAELHSPHFPHLVILDEEDEARMLRCEFFHIRGKRDLIVLTGDTQSVTPEGHYDFCEKVLEFSRKMGVKDVITLGAFPSGELKTEPRVVAAVSDKSLKKKYPFLDFGKDHPVGTIIGAAGLMAGMGRNYGMNTLILMGETFGMPLMMDPKAADRILHVLMKILGLKLDLSKLEKTVAEMEERLKKTEEIHKKLLEDMPKSKEDVRYIG